MCFFVLTPPANAKEDGHTFHLLNTAIAITYHIVHPITHPSHTHCTQAHPSLTPHPPYSLAAVLGAEIVSTFDHPEMVKCGHCKLIEEVMIGEDKVIRFSGCARGEACTVVIRGPTTHILEEADRYVRPPALTRRRSLTPPRTWRPSCRASRAPQDAPLASIAPLTLTPHTTRSPSVPSPPHCQPTHLHCR